MNSDNQKKRIKLPLHAYLLYLLVASLLFTGVSFSSYVATTSGADSARVARFDVTIEGSNDNLMINELYNKLHDDYCFYVNNNSEVTIHCSKIILRFEMSIPTGVAFTINGNQFKQKNDKRDEFIIDCNLLLPPATKSEIIKIDIDADNTNDWYSGKMDIYVDVQQID